MADEHSGVSVVPVVSAGTDRERWLADLEVLFETVRDLGSTLSVHVVLERLIERTLVHLDSEIASVMLVEGGTDLVLIHARGLPSDLVNETRVALGESISGHVAATGEPLLVDDIETDSRFQRSNNDERYYTHSFISAPLIYQGRTRGVLNVNNKRNRSSYEPADLRLLEAIAGHAAVALANARRYEQMEQRAQRDALTNLANHGFFWSTIESEVQRADRHARPLSLVMADVDHFKAFNDRYGHREGDAALVAVANAIDQSSRAHDLAARYGGEEFAVILPETPLPGALIFAEKIRQAVEHLDGRPTTISVGAACLVDTEGTAAALVEAADAQLYKAKAAGRNRVCPPV